MKIIIIFFLLMLTSWGTFAVDVPIVLFLIEHYKQNTDIWLNPTAVNYNQLLLSKIEQKYRFKQFYNHLFSTNIPYQENWQWGGPPWNKSYIKEIFIQEPNLKSIELNILRSFNNKIPGNSYKFGLNFRKHNSMWIKSIKDNIKLKQFERLKFHKYNRGIVVNNTHIRLLPTNDVAFLHFTLPGNGYPFDLLQMSSVWVGTPIYILAETRDKAWDYVITPSIIGWLPSNKIAHVTDKFISSWQQLTKKNLAAIINTKTSVISNRGFEFYGYIGTVFPLTHMYNKSNQATILIPIRTTDGFAKIFPATVNSHDIKKIPMLATRHNFAILLKSLVNRPYGWAGMYFYNDCSSELKNLYAPFGIWLPINSALQVHAGRSVDKTRLTKKQRLQYLANHGHPLMTVIYIGGHVMLYIGNYMTDKHKKFIMTYQDKWGLEPNDGSYRSIIGESVFFPLLSQYKEDKNLESLANKKYFIITNIDQLPNIKSQHGKINLYQLAAADLILHN